MWDVAWNPDGTQLVTASSDKTVRIWDVNSADQTQVLRLDAHRISWASDSKRLAVTDSWSGVVSSWDPVASYEYYVDRVSQSNSVSASPAGNKLAYSGNNEVKVWDGKAKSYQSVESEQQFQSVDWNQDGIRLLATHRHEPFIRIWDTVTGQKMDINAPEHPTTAHWSPDGSLIAATSESGLIIVRDSTGKTIWQAQRPERVFETRFSPDGSQLASAEAGAITIFDTATGKELAILDDLKERFVSVDWSPDATRLVSGGSSSVAIWDTASGRLACKLPATGAQCVRWSPDGRKVAAAWSTAGVFIWDASRGYELDSVANLFN